jgi:hypothetical protein
LLNQLRAASRQERAGPTAIRIGGRSRRSPLNPARIAA